MENKKPTLDKDLDKIAYVEEAAGDSSSTSEVASGGRFISGSNSNPLTSTTIPSDYLPIGWCWNIHI